MNKSEQVLIDIDVFLVHFFGHLDCAECNIYLFKPQGQKISYKGAGY